MNSMMILEVLGIIEVVGSELVSKVAKETGQNFARCTGTPHQKQKCTGIGLGCTGTCVPKMPRMLCFCVFKPELVHR